MSASANPDIVDDGLVFLYDTDDGKSYKGEPTENLVPVGDRTLTTVLQRQSWHIAEWTYSLETNINGRADVLKIYINPTGSESSQPYADFGFQAYKSGGSQVGDVYAITFDYYVTKSTNTPSLIVAYANGYKSPTSASAASLGTITTTDLGNGWVRATRIATITTAGNTHWRFGLSSNYNETEVYVDNFQVELKSHATPFVDGTRSATQGLLDRTGNTTIDLSNVSFDSNAQMTAFDGTDDYISLSQNVTVPAVGFTVMMAINVNDSQSSSSWNYWFKQTANDGHKYEFGCYGTNGNQFQFKDNIIGSSSVVATLNSSEFTILHFGSTSSSYSFYSKNGESKVLSNSSGGWTGGDDINFSEFFRTGSSYFGAKAINMLIYNKELSQKEILQNFNATKSRFGL